MRHIIACDCGGTKSAFMLCGEDGSVLGRTAGGTANACFEDEASIVDKLLEALRRLLDETEVDPASVEALGGVIMLGASGRGLLEKELKGLLPKCELRAYYECLCNLVASTGGFEGTIAHSGTGSFGYARQGGRDYHYGGMGSYLGDEGSGYYIGLHVFLAVKNSLVGLGPETALTDMLFEHWQVRRLPSPSATAWELAGKCVAFTAESRLKISRLTLLAERAARNGDPVARGILQDAAKAMAGHIHVLVEKEGVRPEGLLSVSGGTWRCGPDFLETFRELTTSEYPGFEFVYPKTEPIGGCALMLLRDIFGVSPSEEIIRRLSGPPV